METQDETTSDSWILEKKIRELMVFMERHIREGYCPHYFIPTLNLFQFPAEQTSKTIINKRFKDCADMDCGRS